jgi:hypothetical protein
VQTNTMTAPQPSSLRAPREVARDWREGLLQDLVAVSILVRTVHARLTADGAPAPLLDVASGTLDSDLELVRSAIREIEAAAA